ncbi:MAG: mechanosensitive ion channel [Deltaproteobacteria bacterium]|nr:mechanosensitive ion channel [Deltaproteobacteria bacterium]
MPFELSLEYLQYIASDKLVPFAINAAVALAIFIVGRWIAKAIRNAFAKYVGSKLDASLSKFLSSMLYALLLAVIIIAALERLGVKTTAAIAIIGAAGLAVGLALQGSLGNFASGVMLIIFRPFKVGDLVTLSGNTGVVQEVAIFTTILATPDNKTVIIPNGQITSATIVNLTARGTLRIDLEVGVGYSDDLGKAQTVLEGVLTGDDRILKDPAPQVAVASLGESSVNFVVRPWVKVDDYWDVRFDVTRRMKESLDEAGLNIPFPQRDVHMHQVGGLKAA